jgi:hypothetical protein
LPFERLDKFDLDRTGLDKDQAHPEFGGLTVVGARLFEVQPGWWPIDHARWVNLKTIDPGLGGCERIAYDNANLYHGPQVEARNILHLCDSKACEQLD